MWKIAEYMSATVNLRNDRNAIIAVVAEHYLFDDKYLKRATIKGINDPEREPGLQPIHHNSNWIFAYDTKKNVIYWRS